MEQVGGESRSRRRPTRGKAAFQRSSPAQRFSLTLESGRLQRIEQIVASYSALPLRASSLRERPFHRVLESVLVVLEGVQQLNPGELSCVVRTERDHRETGNDEPLDSKLQLDHFLR